MMPDAPPTDRERRRVERFEQLERDRGKRSYRFTSLSNWLADGPAFKALTYAPAIKVLLWFWQKAVYVQSKRMRKSGGYVDIGNLSQIVNNGQISFTYTEAEWRGLTSQQFAKALKELFRFGFIDVKTQGRGVQGAYSLYALSDRWKLYGTTKWEDRTFPPNFKEGFRAGSKGKNNGENPQSQTVKNRRYRPPNRPRDCENSPLENSICAVS